MLQLYVALGAACTAAVVAVNIDAATYDPATYCLED
jgi:hypothetical protein